MLTAVRPGILKQAVAVVTARLRGGVNDTRTIEVDAINGWDRYAFAFTVIEPTIVDSVLVAVCNQGGDMLAGTKIGIATGITADTVNATFIASHVLTSALPKNGYRRVDMDAPAVLMPGTTYFYCLEGVSDNGYGVLFSAGTADPTIDGNIASAASTSANISRFGTGNYAANAGIQTAYAINPAPAYIGANEPFGITYVNFAHVFVPFTVSAPGDVSTIKLGCSSGASSSDKVRVSLATSPGETPFTETMLGSAAPDIFLTSGSGLIVATFATPVHIPAAGTVYYLMIQGVAGNGAKYINGLNDNGTHTGVVNGAGNESGSNGGGWSSFSGTGIPFAINS